MRGVDWVLKNEVRERDSVGESWQELAEPVLAELDRPAR